MLQLRCLLYYIVWTHAPADSLAADQRVMVTAGDDNLLLSVGEAIEKLLQPTPEPPAPTCTGCSPVAGTSADSNEFLTRMKGLTIYALSQRDSFELLCLGHLGRTSRGGCMDMLRALAHLVYVC